MSSVWPGEDLQSQQQQQFESSVEEQEEDTIYALSSGSSSGQATAVAVVRLSGPQAPFILQQLSSTPKLPSPRQATLRKLYHPTTKQPLDQALVLYFPQPHSFTGQDVVELHCHGSRAVLQGLLEALSEFDQTRYAEPGEFTQRAWLAGKMDVLQIEALADLLLADTDRQKTLALKQLDGQLSAIYQDWRQELIAGLAHAEAVIDFGDDERLGNDDDDSLLWDDFETQQQVQQESVWGGITDSMDQLCRAMKRQLQDQRRGELVREGLQIAIVGPPNAGKSSLFNLLAKRDAAIVSPTAGTTRDVLEISLNLGGVKCMVQDTAGVRHATDDVIELEGMKRALNAAQEADLVVVMVDSMDTATGMTILNRILLDSPEHASVNESDVADYEKVLNANQVFLVRNKSDLTKPNVDDNLSDIYHGNLSDRIGGVFDVSCITQDGIDAFLDALTARVVSRIAGNDDDSTDDMNEGILITRARHRQLVQAAVEALERFNILSQQGTMAVDMAAEELRLAASELGRITGAVDVEDVLDKLFADFCIGK